MKRFLLEIWNSRVLNGWMTAKEKNNLRRVFKYVLYHTRCCMHDDISFWEGKTSTATYSENSGLIGQQTNFCRNASFFNVRYVKTRTITATRRKVRHVI